MRHRLLGVGMRRVSEFVEHERFLAGEEDAHGNPVEGWGPRVRVGVYAFDPGSTSEPRLPGHDRVIVEPTLYAPSGVVFGFRDRVMARGLLYEVEGDTRVWRHPTGLAPGNVVSLRRVVG